MTLRSAIEQRYPYNGGLVPAMRERITDVTQAYLDAGHGDSKALQRLCSAGDSPIGSDCRKVSVRRADLSDRPNQAMSWH